MASRRKQTLGPLGVDQQKILKSTCLKQPTSQRKSIEAGGLCKSIAFNLFSNEAILLDFVAVILLTRPLLEQPAFFDSRLKQSLGLLGVDQKKILKSTCLKQPTFHRKSIEAGSLCKSAAFNLFKGRCPLGIRRSHSLDTPLLEHPAP